MNTTGLFLDSAQTVHFLSLFTYLSKLSDIFYSEELLRAEDKHEPFPIVNAYYEHLKGKNETEAKQHLVQKLLEGSELYGGQRNETLDMGYINNTLDYIITNAVFAQSGNIYGYLAEIASISNSLKLSVFKTKVLDHLSLLRQLKNDGDVSNLTKLATDKIAETIIWPLFPNPPNDMEIISLKYIYALGGYNLAKSAQMNMTDIIFSRYVTLGMTIEASAIGDELPISVLQFFALSAMIYYAKNQTEKFNQQTTKNLIRNQNVWSEAFLTLFTFLNSTLEMIRQETLESNSLYQFHLAISDFKNRTFIARDIIKRECKYLNESSIESLIDDYKTYSASTRCHQKDKLLPNLELAYDAQFHNIKEKYRLMEIDFVRAAFNEFPSLRDLINSSKATVFRSFPIPYDMRCNMCSPRIPSYNQNINFFAIKSEGEIQFYAIEQNENNVKVLVGKNNKDFNRLVGLPEGRNLEISGFIKIYKQAGGNFESFLQNFAEMKAEQFRSKLFAYGYEKTSMEKFFEFMKSFIPFYHCVKFAKAGEQGLAAFSCFGDVLSFIPLARFLNFGIKVGTITASRFLLASGITLKTFTLRQAIHTIMITGLREAAMGFKTMFTKVFLTKQNLKYLSIAVIRSLDPGFELVGKLAWQGSVTIGRVINTVFKLISKKFPSLNFKYAKYESIWSHLTLSDDLKMLPELHLEGREVFRFMYPGGKNPFGPKYVRLSKNYAEMRKMVGFEKEIPVIVTRVTKRRIIYRRVNLKTEEPFGLELKLNREGYLENARQPFRQHIYKIKTQGLGGRGALLVKREKSIEEVARVVINTNVGLSKWEIEQITRHYTLAIDEPVSVNDLVDTSTDLMNFDNSLNAEIHDLLKNYNLDPVVDLTLNEYLPVPTYRMFALDWARTGIINPIYQTYYVTNFVELDKLLYNIRMESPQHYNMNMANSEIYSLYEPNFVNRMRVTIEQVLTRYLRDDAWHHVTFVDYYALLTWKYSAYKVLKNYPLSSNLLKKSLFRLAIRQTTEENLPNVLYYFETGTRYPANMDYLRLVDRTITSKTFIRATADDEVVENAVIQLAKTLVVDDVKQIRVHKLNIDSSYLTIDLRKIIPNERLPFIVLPGVVFKIKKVEETTIAGHNVIMVEVNNKHVVKEMLIAQLMNMID